ncbi:MAG: 3-dehydroquinate synthase [Candidatus Poribacteria bacterium]|nr:3-dehydroquinate synthase [Candidatus Poribacteria bacterium]
MNARAIRVNLADRSYDIRIGHGIRAELPKSLDFIRQGAQIALVASPELKRLYGDALVKSLRDAGYAAWLAEMPDGEQFKTMATASLLYDQFIERRMERNSLVVALGGGVTGDVAGFVAATYMRGVPFVQMPTTLISQVDSSVGGKVAVDHPKGKNLIGAFHQPKLVLIDAETLDSLPARQFRSGIAEVMRYGVIASPTLFRTLETRMDAILAHDPTVLTDIITESCSIKARIVEEDETESGVRATLNYGHTFAHAIEAVTHYETFLHGEAVAVGMLCAGEMAKARGLVDQSFCDRQRALIVSAGLPPAVPAELDAAEIVDAMKLDKKVAAGRIRFIVPTGIGSVEIRDDFSDADAQAAINATRA